MATVGVPLLVCVGGLLTWVFAGNGKASEAGKWAYVVGLFWTVGAAASSHVHF